MSTATDTDAEYAGEAPRADHEAHQHQHPSDRSYIVIAAILAVITAAEVATYFFDDSLNTTALVILLFPMMIAKFAIVCGWFMHLKYDNPLFKRVFVFGLLLAVGVYIIALTSMEFWSSSYGT
jgi:cytochrome c oxidase subunit 4